MRKPASEVSGTGHAHTAEGGQSHDLKPHSLSLLLGNGSTGRKHTPGYINEAQQSIFSVVRGAERVRSYPEPDSVRVVSKILTSSYFYV